MTVFEKVTASPEALAELLDSLTVIDSPWEEAFHRVFCDSCIDSNGTENCDTPGCPHEKERNNPTWWLAQVVDPNCKAALRWWCNAFGAGSRLNIEKCRLLKEFMIANPPDFPISDGCYKGAKKDVAHDFMREIKATINMVGIRKAEGGARATAYNSCFSEPSSKSEAAQFRPLFYITDSDKELYCQRRGVVHSDLYEKHGFVRTGCACCPFWSRFEQELQAADQLDPGLARAVRNIFGAAYEYTRAYRRFKEQHDAEKKNDKNQISMFWLTGKCTVRKLRSGNIRKICGRRGRTSNWETTTSWHSTSRTK